MQRITIDVSYNILKIYIMHITLHTMYAKIVTKQSQLSVIQLFLWGPLFKAYLPGLDNMYVPNLVELKSA